jgi:hypothetical protein
MRRLKMDEVSLNSLKDPNVGPIAKQKKEKKLGHIL